MERRKTESWREEASTELPSLPIELITEILLRSPVKSVGRFRCVSKDFRSLLSDPKFAKNPLDLALRDDPRERGLILTLDSLLAVDFDSINDDGSYPFKDLTCVELDYPLKNNQEYLSETWSASEKLSHRIRNLVYIVGSSKGLVCIYQKKSGAFLFNPTTGESKKVPNLVDEKLVDFEVHGFGYDVLTDDYKLVNFVKRKDRELNAIVYYLKTDSWRPVRNMCYKHIQNSYGVHLNGAIHWIVKLEDKTVVAAFDLKTEEFREILLPDAVEECNHIVTRLELGSLKGCLCVSYMCNDMHDEIWVMNEYGLHSSWSKIRVLIPYTYMIPLCSTKNDEEVLLMIDSSLVLYNFESNTWRSLGICGVKLSDGFEANTYVESLISPNSYGIER